MSTEIGCYFKAASQKLGEKKSNCSLHLIGEVTSNPIISCFANENINELALVRKFHNSISAGPLHQHSVSPADQLVNPEMNEYLQSVKSVDDIEWICQTRNNHIKKGRVLPCAIANDMQFPEKPSFFNLNELECRLIAPRLAFQKFARLQGVVNSRLLVMLMFQ